MQCARDQPALVAGADQHRDVRAGERLALDRDLAARAKLQEADDLVGGRARDDGVHVLLREELVFLGAGVEPELQRSATFAGRDPQGIAAVPGRGHRTVFDLGRHERGGPREDRVHRLDEGGDGAPVALEMETLASRAPGREIGEYVRPAEPVDGLLRIAHHDEGARGCAPGPDGAACAPVLDPLVPFRLLFTGKVGLTRCFGVRRFTWPGTPHSGGVAFFRPAFAGHTGPGFTVDPAEDAGSGADRCPGTRQ